MNDHPYEQEIRAWVQKAADDLVGAKAILREKAPAWIACFHCHQVAEKSLKAALLFYTNSYPKEHDLIKLVEILRQAEVEVKPIMEALEILAEYYVTTRYPGPIQYVLSHDQAKQAISFAQQVLDFINLQLTER